MRLRYNLSLAITFLFMGLCSVVHAAPEPPRTPLPVSTNQSADGAATLIRLLKESQGDFEQQAHLIFRLYSTGAYREACSEATRLIRTFPETDQANNAKALIAYWAALSQYKGGTTDDAIRWGAYAAELGEPYGKTLEVLLRLNANPSERELEKIAAETRRNAHRDSNIMVLDAHLALHGLGQPASIRNAESSLKHVHSEFEGRPLDAYNAIMRFDQLSELFVKLTGYQSTLAVLEHMTPGNNTSHLRTKSILNLLIKDANNDVPAAVGYLALNATQIHPYASLSPAQLQADLTPTQREQSNQYDQILGIERSDIRTATSEWLERAVELEYLPAVYQEATQRTEAAHKTGAGVQNAVALWYQVAQLGNPEGYFGIGELLIRSYQYKEAARWLAKGADAGEYHSIFALAIMHEIGIGVPKNTKTAATYRRQLDTIILPETAAPIDEQRFAPFIRAAATETMRKLALDAWEERRREASQQLARTLTKWLFETPDPPTAPGNIDPNCTTCNGQGWVYKRVTVDCPMCIPQNSDGCYTCGSGFRMFHDGTIDEWKWVPCRPCANR
ncbi:MAG: hypothetical protein Tsb0013_07710 [Phycisphaerales bacterium]